MDFSNIEFLLSVHRLQQLPPEELPEVAFAGRSNVGKSSLINVLVGRKALVKVSSRPGKTQGLNYFRVDDKFHLVDLPGYGFAKVPKGMQNAWQSLISSYLTSRKTLRCVVVIIDIRHEAKQLDSQLLQFLKDAGSPACPSIPRRTNFPVTSATEMPCCLMPAMVSVKVSGWFSLLSQAMAERNSSRPCRAFFSDFSSPASFVVRNNPA